VFDSRTGLGDQIRRGAIEVVYTSGETADDWMIRKVREIPNPRVVVVVTDDQSLRRLIRGTGARWLSCSDFLKSDRNRPPQASDVDMPPPDYITEEFRKRWS
jgi:predicted RNA-binding protein with PIN domain